MSDLKDNPLLRQYFRRCINQKSPFAKAGFFSHLFFTWLNPIIDIATKVDFEQKMHYDLRSEDESAKVSEQIEKNWAETYPEGQIPPGTKTPVMGFFKVIWRTFRLSILAGVFGQIAMIGIEFLNTYLIYIAIEQVKKINYSEESQEQADSNKQLITNTLVFMLFFIVLRISSSVFNSLLNFRLSLTGLKLRNALNVMIYKKIMKKSLERDTTFDIGDITNLTQTDAQAFANLSFNAGFVICIPFRIIFGIIGLYFLMGKAMLAASSIIVVLAIINAYLTSLYDKIKTSYLEVSDKRGKLINEVFKNIRFIKMIGLETYYLLKLESLRDEELSWVRKQLLRNITTNFNNSLGPSLFLLTLYAAKLWQEGSLTLSEAFVSGMVFGLFQSSIRSVGFFVIFLLDCVVSARRICFFLLSEEVRPQHITHNLDTRTTSKSESAIEISNGNFYWVDRKTRQAYRDEKDRIKNKKNKETAKDPIKEAQSVRTTKFMASDSSIRDLSLGLLEADTSIDDGSERENEVVLKAFTHQIKKGACVGIIGKVGAGKSTLLSSLLGETYCEEGTQVIINGSIAYVSQKPWITSQTVREIITFGSDFSEHRFNESIRCSAMEDDIKSMSNGVDTLLGDRGVNLSGGQKTRMAIARAFYSNKDIYLFDDPISALDVHVGKVVMEEGIMTFLKGKTRLVATHALSYLPYFDYILILDQGRLVEKGAYCDIIKSPIYQEIKKSIGADQDEPEGVVEEELSPLELIKRTSSKKPRKMSLEESLEEAGQTAGEQPTSDPEPSSQSAEKSETDKVIDHIISTEEKAKGDVVTLALFHQFVQFGGGYGIWIPSLVAMGLWSVCEFLTPWFLQYWTTDHPLKKDVWTFVWVMLALAFIGVTARTLTNFAILMASIRLSKQASFLMSFKLVHASINNFFDRVPTGRILNRFLRDLNELDWNLSYATWYLVYMTFLCLTDFIAAVYASSPVMLVFIFIYFYISARTQRRYMTLYREVVRLKSISSSPMVQAFSEAVQGVCTIRSYRRTDYALASYLSTLDEFQKNCIIGDALSRWFVLRLMVLSVLILAPGILLNLFFVKSGAGLFALLMRYLLVVISDINELLDTVSNQENRMIAFERCAYFGNIQPEKGYKELAKLESMLQRGFQPVLKETDWPECGSISIQQLKVKYRKNLKYVIKGISLDVRHGAKVGIVGRTGAGKTTFVSALYRNFDEYEGDIYLDGKELRSVDLKILRSKITIIPQDPYLFQDTVRNNLDPLQKKTDHEMTSVLQDIQLWDKFATDGGLDFMIDQAGSNLSQGQKQLLCLARALLHENKLILMDEATANIDTQSEQVIQKMLSERFEDCTIFMIAHRLNTILHCDMILVLEAGEVLEFGPIEELKRDTKSHFHTMLSKYEDMHQNLT